MRSNRFFWRLLPFFLHDSPYEHLTVILLLFAPVRHRCVTKPEPNSPSETKHVQAALIIQLPSVRNINICVRGVILIIWRVLMLFLLQRKEKAGRYFCLKLVFSVLAGVEEAGLWRSLWHLESRSPALHDANRVTETLLFASKKLNLTKETSYFFFTWHQFVKDASLLQKVKETPTMMVHGHQAVC